MKTKLFLSILMLLSTLSFAHSQDAEQTPARQAFDAVFGEWKDVLAQMRTLQAEAQNKEDSELPPLVAEYDKLIVKGESLIPKLAESAIAVYKEAPNEDRQISRWLSTIASDYVVADRFADAKPVLDALIEGKASDPTVLNNAGIVAFAANDYEAAKQHLEAAAAAGVLTSQSQNMLNVVDDYVEYWAAEKKLRDRADALSDEARLPRVKMETNRGTLVVELFEDEAPETVGNFVNLVELNTH